MAHQKSRGASIGDGLSTNDRWLIRRVPRQVLDNIIAKLGAAQVQKSIAREEGVEMLSVSSIKKALRLGVLEQTWSTKPIRTTGHKRAAQMEEFTRARTRDAALKRAIPGEDEDPERDPVYLATVLRHDKPTQVREQGKRERDARETPVEPTDDESGAPIYTGLPNEPVAKDAAESKASMTRAEYLARLRKVLRERITPERKAEILLKAADSDDPKVAAYALKEINILDGTSDEVEKMRNAGGDDKPGIGLFLLSRSSMPQFTPVSEEDISPSPRLQTQTQEGNLPAAKTLQATEE